MRITYNPEANAAYLALLPVAPGQVAETFVLTDALNLDVDKNGILLGLEILDATSFFGELTTVFSGELVLPERIDRETFDPGTFWQRQRAAV